MSDLESNIVPSLPRAADLLDGIGTVESPIDFLEGGPTSLNEKEINGDELNDQPTFKEEVKLPATGVDADRNDILRQGQADIGGKALHE